MNALATAPGVIATPGKYYIGAKEVMEYLDCKIRLARVPAANGIMISETDSGFSTPMAFIRTIISKDKDDNVIRKVEFWNSSLVMRFQSLNNGYLNMIAVEEHYWQDVPFVEYINNEERLGDFEGVITEIDAYNKVQSNTANYFQYNDDAILKVLKLGDVSSQDIADMKEKGAIILEDGGDVDWLLKTIDDTALENYKNRLREDIHTGANVPHMCDESFGGNLSGVAISYKLWGLEQICSIKERKFKKGLQRRIELITNILNIMGHNYDYRDIVPKFRRNRPQNDMETAQIMPLVGDSDNEGDDEDGDLMDIDVNDAAASISKSMEGFSGSKVESMMKKLLIAHKNVVVELPVMDEDDVETGEYSQEILDMDIVNEIFCGDVQDMFILAFYVIRLNFNGFFKRLAGPSGKAGEAIAKKMRKIL